MFGRDCTHDNGCTFSARETQCATAVLAVGVALAVVAEVDRNQE